MIQAIAHGDPSTGNLPQESLNLETDPTKTLNDLVYLALKELIHSPLVCQNIFLKYVRRGLLSTSSMT